jgi:hypothetical protein
MREVANQQTSGGPVAGIAEALAHRIRHPDFPANCRPVNEQIANTGDVLDYAAANFLKVLGDCQLLGAKSDADKATVASMQGPDLIERSRPSPSCRTAPRSLISSLLEMDASRRFRRPLLVRHDQQ